MRIIFTMRIYLFLIGMVGVFCTTTAQATITCSADNVRTDTLQITPINISAGPDLPLGSVLYRGTWKDPDGSYVALCRTDDSSGEAGSIRYNLGIELAPYPLSSWSGSPYSGRVYSTNIPGVGIAVWYAHNAVTESSSYATGSPFEFEITAPHVNKRLSWGSSFDISLVKIGDTPPGNYTIQASTFPTVKRFVTAGSSNVTGLLPFTARTIIFSGSLTVSAQTCTTPDVDVYLGAHDVSSFASVESTTPWVDSSIKLTNCPTAQGYFNNQNPVNLSTGVVPASTSNQFGITLSPTNNIFDATNGIMEVTPSPFSATGVGIQIAHGKIGATDPLPFNLNTESRVDFPKNGDSTIVYHLVARYIKTGTKVTSGLAEGKLTITVNYY